MQAHGLRLKLSNNQVQVLVKFRLGVNLLEEVDPCKDCLRQETDVKAHHALLCREVVTVLSDIMWSEICFWS
jgi:hypothetical protein